MPSSDLSLSNCVPNATLRCYCGILEGTQTCTADRELTACNCKQPSSTTPRPKPSGTGTSTDTTEPPPPPPGPVCGDGNVDPGEACDDGNTVDGDGCSSKCKPDGAPASAEACGGQAVKLWQGSTLVLAGTTDGYKDDLKTSCYPDSVGPDRVYAVEPSADGFMQVSAVFAPNFHAVIEVREGTCESSDAQILCDDSLGRAFEGVVEVKAGKTYYVIIDGDLPDAHGAYSIKLELP
jgi:cysteine-rich repeat protein